MKHTSCSFNLHFKPAYLLIVTLGLFLFNCKLPTDPSEFAPQDLSYEKDEYSVYVGDEIKAIATYQYFVDSLTITPPLPPDLHLDSLSGTIHGKAMSALSRTPFTVKAFNKNGSTAVVVFLEVISFPSFIVQPQNVNVTTNGTVTITAKATGKEPLVYSWQKDGNALSGENSSTLTVKSASSSDAGIYRCIVKDANGKTTQSDPAVCKILTETELPKITVNPGSRSATTGESVILLSQATGTDLAYRWLLNGVVIPDATFPYLKIENFSASDSGIYMLIAYNQFAADTSNPGTHLTISEFSTDFFDLSLAIMGEGSILYNSAYIYNDTLIKIQKNSSFALTFLPKSNYNVLSVSIDNNVNAEAQTTGQYSFSQFDKNHQVIVTYTSDSVPPPVPDSFSLLISVNSKERGSTSTEPNDTKFIANSPVKIIAIPKEGFYFTGWSGSIEGINPLKDTITMIMNSDKTIKANFIETGKFSINTTVVPQNGGNILIQPEQTSYSKGAVVKVIAVPKNGFLFSSWSGSVISKKDTVEMTIDANMQITASFMAIQVSDSFTVSVLLSDNSAGSLDVTPKRTIFKSGETVQITAHAKDGFYFASWSGLSNTEHSLDSTITLTVQENITVTAIFTPKSTFSVSAATTIAGGSVSISPIKEIYLEGDTITLTARADIGYSFTKWSDDVSGTTNPYTFVVTKSLSVSAVFTPSGTIEEIPAIAGSDLHALIKDISSKPIPGAILTPEKGKFSNNTIEILGKVTIPIQRR